MAVRFSSNVPNVLAAIEREKRIKLFQAGNIARNKVVEKLRNEGTGRTYKVPGTSVTYTASAPGQPPAGGRTGTLRRSYRLDPESAGGIDDRVAIGSDLDYALMLEKGTRTVLPRPHLEPAMREAEPEIRAILGDNWRLE